MKWSVAVLACWVATPARAEVFLGDPVIEVGAEYGSGPLHFGGQFDPVQTTAIHVTDRNGLFAKAVFKTLGADQGAPLDPEHHHYEVRVWENLGVAVVKDTITYDSPEEMQRREAERAKYRAAFDAFNAFNTELFVYVPRDGTSNTRGASFGMTAAVIGSGNLRIETGLRWSYIKAPVCGSEMDPTTCNSKFIGMPLRAVISLRRLGMFEVGIDWNWRRRDNQGETQNRTPLHATLTLNPLDRVFVRGRVLDTTSDLGKPGFAIELGGRL